MIDLEIIFDKNIIEEYFLIEATQERDAVNNIEWQKLSKEAKEVVTCIIERHNDIKHCFTSKHYKPNQKTLEKLNTWLSDLIGSDKSIRTLEEIKAYVCRSDFKLPYYIYMPKRKAILDENSKKMINDFLPNAYKRFLKNVEKWRGYDG